MNDYAFIYEITEAEADRYDEIYHHFAGDGDCVLSFNPDEMHNCIDSDGSCHNWRESEVWEHWYSNDFDYAMYLEAVAIKAKMDAFEAAHPLTVAARYEVTNILFRHSGEIDWTAVKVEID